MFRLLINTVLALMATQLATSVGAQEITLKSSSGAIEVSGILLDYDGDTYKIRSSFGDLTLNSTGIVCFGHACPNPSAYATNLSLNVSRSIGETLLPALIEDYAFANGLTVQRQQDGRDAWNYHVADRAGFAVATIGLALSDTTHHIANMVDISAGSKIAIRPATTAETAQIKVVGAAGLVGTRQRHILALDALVLITAKQNPVPALSIKQIAGVFSGSITNWADLGGADAPIILYKRDHDADLTAMFRTKIWHDSIGRKFAGGPVFMSNDTLSDAVAADPFAIGFTDYANIRNAHALGLRGSCGHILTPSAFNLKAEDYPLTRHLYFDTKGDRPTGFMRGFLAYLDSRQAQRTISDLGYVSRDIDALPLADQGVRLNNAIKQANDEPSFQAVRDMAALLTGASRLSTTFRFSEASSTLDARSRDNATRLARLVEQGDFDGQTLLIAGFSDGNGSSGGNQRISLMRAGQVAAAIKSRATKADLSKVTFQMAGLGEISPIGCDQVDWGRRVNRRVEIWLKPSKQLP